MKQCFDIGGSKIVAARVGMQGQIHEQARMPTPLHDFDDFCHVLETYCNPEGEAIYLSVAGVIHPQTGVMVCANIPCISGRTLADDLSSRLSRKVCLVNDANAFALAEVHFGPARGHSQVLAVILGTGVGGAIVSNGLLVAGQNGTAGEWGHGPASTLSSGLSVPVLDCPCGQRGCVDTLGGARGLERLHEHAHQHKADSEQIIQHWQQGCNQAALTVATWLDVMGGALAATVNVIDPSIVAVGGGLAKASCLIEALDKEVRKRCLASHESPLLYHAALGPEQGLRGASLLDEL